MRDYLNIAVSLTLLNAISGFLAIVSVIKGKFLIGIILLIFAGIFDFLDGKVARKLKQESKFGLELDSLADIVSFGVVPAVLGVVLSPDYLTIISAIFFLCCGILRLARFNILTTDFFIGVPITTNFIIFPVLFYFEATALIYQIIYIIMGLLMISSIKVKKWA